MPDVITGFMSADILQSPLLWTLIALQIAMGGFDVIFHHELTERLAWKDNASGELRLHAWRNVFYGFLFTFFAWVQPHGAIAIAVLIILVVEIIITLWDFVEEDQTRKLPPTERVLHTLLAINYGAILALVMPLLVMWAGQPTGVDVVSYGFGSLILTLAGIGCIGFAIRDTFTSRRAARFQPSSPAALAGILHGKRSVLITGGTGLVGKSLADSLIASGHDVTVLTRDMAKVTGLNAPVRMITSLEQVESTTAIDAIVDLAGEPVAGGLWTRARKREILLSRLHMSRRVNALVARLEKKPEVVISASAVGAYGLTGDDILTEADAAPGYDHNAPSTRRARVFTHRVCLAREEEAAKVRAQGVRFVALRIGLVLDRDGGLLSRMVPAFDLGLGGPIGDGQQWMSWIALPDLVRLIAFAIQSDELDGAVNATAPTPVRNATFAKSLGTVLHRPAILPVPGWPLETVLGDFARELLLGGQRVVPLKVTSAGFSFQANTINSGLRLALRLPDTVASRREAVIRINADARARSKQQVSGAVAHKV
ncbi:MAG: TIGR01777 family oxidoreductase [Pseudomonadota bacterium]